MNKHLKYILQVMCSYVGADFDSIDFKDGEWFWKYSWTPQQQNEFMEWLVDYLYKNKEARELICEHPVKRKSHLRSVAQMFIFNYGWKLKE
jgi:hypothetical protein